MNAVGGIDSVAPGRKKRTPSNPTRANRGSKLKRARDLSSRALAVYAPGRCLRSAQCDRAYSSPSLNASIPQLQIQPSRVKLRAHERRYMRDPMCRIALVPGRAAWLRLAPASARIRIEARRSPVPGAAYVHGRQ